jgi:hypothetical protein
MNFVTGTLEKDTITTNEPSTLHNSVLLLEARWAEPISNQAMGFLDLEQH